MVKQRKEEIKKILKEIDEALISSKNTIKQVEKEIEEITKKVQENILKLQRLL